MLKEKAEDLFRASYMKEKLFKMLKKNGEFIKVDSDLGFLYSLPIGMAEGREIVLHVALRAGKQIDILDAYVRELEPSI